MTDSDGRLFKFSKQDAVDGKFTIKYIFPSNRDNKLILQLYKNGIGLALPSFDIKVPTSP